ncbi:type I-B CRISPR-associated endonuclease Cas1 [candidate division KSB1 bacterium]|nr:type I-B CRISPR-associated endonuclease Cas1 [candidate division KSB1 bacterium]
MSRNYYIFNPGRLSRKENTLFFRRYKQISDDRVIADFEDELETEPELAEREPEIEYKESGNRKVIPIEDVEAIYVFGEADFNRKFFNFCSSRQIPVHVFNYFGFYSGTFYPREFLNSGELLVQQVVHQQNQPYRIELARLLVEGAAGNITKNLQYYDARGKDCSPFLKEIQELREQAESVKRVAELMGIEGNIRQIYYKAWPLIIDPPIEFTKRVRRPPDNEINALIGFANSMVYTTILGEIYKTQLNPLVSFLHEPGTKRFSLSLDLAEIFKPLLADRLIFTLLNRGQLTDRHFTRKGNVCWLSEEGRKIFVKNFDERLSTTIKHRGLGRNVSYRRLIRLECYKLIRHLLGQKNYKPFVIWW